MPEQSISSGVSLLFIVAFRVVYLGFCALGAFAVPEARNLLGQDYEISGSTFYLPLQLCRPQSIQIDGQILSIDYSEGVKECITLNLLVNACACSVVLSILAVLSFVAIDGYVRMKRTHKHKGMVTGMGIFLCFIVLQTAFTTGALSRQARFYQKLYEDLFDAADYNYDAKVHGSLPILWSTAVAAFLTGVLLGLEAICKLCFASNENLGLVSDKKREQDFRASVAKADPTLNANKTSESSHADVELSKVTSPPVSSSSTNFSWTSLS